MNTPAGALPIRTDDLAVEADSATTGWAPAPRSPSSSINIVDDRVLAARIRSVLGRFVRRAGATDVEHDSAEGVPALQGEGRRSPLAAYRPQRWPPAARLATGVAGAVLMTYGVSRMMNRA
jgi:hypothetical protein